MHTYRSMQWLAISINTSLRSRYILIIRVLIADQPFCVRHICIAVGSKLSGGSTAFSIASRWLPASRCQHRLHGLTHPISRVVIVPMRTFVEYSVNIRIHSLFSDCDCSQPLPSITYRWQRLPRLTAQQRIALYWQAWHFCIFHSLTIGNSSQYFNGKKTKVDFCSGNYLPSHRGCSPLKRFWHTQHRPPLEVWRVLTRTLIGTICYSQL